MQHVLKDNVGCGSLEVPSVHATDTMHATDTVLLHATDTMHASDTVHAMTQCMP